MQTGQMLCQPPQPFASRTHTALDDANNAKCVSSKQPPTEASLGLEDKPQRITRHAWNTGSASTMALFHNTCAPPRLCYTLSVALRLFCDIPTQPCACSTESIALRGVSFPQCLCTVMTVLDCLWPSVSLFNSICVLSMLH